MKLTKIKIINWMYIDNTTIDINNNAVLIGENGSGKTTIVDAIQYALTGSKGDSKFNSAQGTSTRNLESYVRGTVGSKEKEHLRPSNTISYVLVQLEDDEKTHVFGVALEYVNKLKENRFYLKNQDIKEEYFLDGNDKYKDYKMFKEQFSSEDFESLHSRGAYQSKLSEVMGLLPNSSYFKLLGKALQLKSLDNINNFISEFLLEVEELDISSLQDVISNIKRVRMAIEDNREKAMLLKKINEQGDYITELVKNIEINQHKASLAKKIIIEDNIKTKRKELNDFQSNKLKYEFDESIINKKLNQNRSKIKLIEKKFDEVYPDLSEYKRDIMSKEDLILKYDVEITSLEEKFKEDIKVLNSSKLRDGSDQKIHELLIKIHKNRQIETSAFLVNEFDNFKKLVVERVTVIKKDLEVYKRNQIEQLKTLEYDKNELKNLELGIQTYPQNTRLLIAKIKEDLFDYYKVDIEVGVLSQYLEIKGNKYRNAIEGYLDRNRFNVLVEPKYYDSALKTYHRYSNEIYGVNLIDTTKVKSSEIKNGTLSEFIIGNNKHALNYVYSLLNRVNYVDSINDLNKHKTAITEDCMLYSGFIVRKINPDNYNKQYIGQEALIRNINIQKSKIEKQTEILNETISLVNESNTIIEIYSRLNLSEYNSTTLTVYQDKIMLSKELSKLKEIVNNVENESEYVSLSDEHNKLILQDKKMDNELKIIYQRIAETNHNIQQAREFISVNSEKLEEINYEISLIDPIKITTISNVLNNISLSDKYLSDLDKEKNKYESDKLSKEARLEINMKDYIYKFNENFKANLEDISKYKESYNKINIVQFDLESKLASLEISLNKIITSEFISKINTNIYRINNTIKDINRKLKQSVFGEDSTYKVIAEPSDDPNYNKLYEIASRNDVRNKTLLNSEQVEKDHEDIEQVLNQFNDHKQNLNINDVLDVRNYFKFDVVVNSKNQTKYLSEVIQTQSGGEIQTPFYILITAAFEQTKDPRRMTESFNLVLFDEAFSNMDPQRISEMLKYYDKFNIQTIISVPSKLESLGSYVNTALGVTRKGETTYVYQVEKDYRA